jgi:hypothetical protein
MILTPIAPDRLPALLAQFDAALPNAASRAVFRRIARGEDAARAAGAAAASHHRAALGLLSRLGMGLATGAPSAGFGWDGQAARCDTQAYVLLHEAAHFQVAAPARRAVIDFGLGPGPETGRRAEALREARLTGLAAEHEEARASLLGILWEVELGQPGLASLLDQNWLEGAARPAATRHFESVLAGLYSDGLVTAPGRPTLKLRDRPDAPGDLLGSGQGATRPGVVDMDGEATLVERRLRPAEPAPRL